MRETEVCIPLALQVVIDDVGWWSGFDDSSAGGPYRTGMRRNHCPADYAAVVELGKRLGVRPLAAMIVCEWDRTDTLRSLPSSTWLGEDWSNAKWVGPWLDEAASILSDNREYVELCVHGVGHEFWDGKGFTRAEWFDGDYRMRPESEVRSHLERFAEILRQNGLGSLPDSLVPPAYKYRLYDPDGFAAILTEYGIRHVVTVTPRMRAETHQSMESDWFGVDGDLLVVEWGGWTRGRGRSALLPWHVAAPDLSEAEEVAGPVLGVHWANLLHPDPARNIEVIERWVAYIERFRRRFDRILARDAHECYSQLLYAWGTDVSVRDGRVSFDFSRIDRLGVRPPRDRFIVKTAGTPPTFAPRPGIIVSPITAPDEEEYRLYSVERA